MSARSGLVGKNAPGPIWGHLRPFFPWTGKNEKCCFFAYFPWWANGPYSPGVGPCCYPPEVGWSCLAALSGIRSDLYSNARGPPSPAQQASRDNQALPTSSSTPPVVAQQTAAPPSPQLPPPQAQPSAPAPMISADSPQQNPEW